MPEDVARKLSTARSSIGSVAGTAGTSSPTGQSRPDGAARAIGNDVIVSGSRPPVTMPPQPTGAFAPPQTGSPKSGSVQITRTARDDVSGAMAIAPAAKAAARRDVRGAVSGTASSPPVGGTPRQRRRASASSQSNPLTNAMSTRRL